MVTRNITCSDDKDINICVPVSIIAGHRCTIECVDFCHIVAGNESFIILGNNNSVKAGHYSEIHGRDNCILSAGDDSHISGGWGSKLSGGDGSELKFKRWSNGKETALLAYVGQDGIAPGQLYHIVDGQIVEYVEEHDYLSEGNVIAFARISR